MGFFQTKDPKTGEPRLGAGVYLIICALMIGGVVLWNVRQNANDPDFIKGQKAQSLPKNPTNVAPVAQAAKNHEETIKDDGTPGVATKVGSVREITPGSGPNIDPTANIKTAETKDDVDTIQNTIDLLRQNQEKAEQEKAAAVAQAKADADAKIAEIKRKSVVTTTTTDDVAPPSTNPNAGRPGTPPPANEQSSVNINSSALVVYDVRRDTKTTVVPKAPVVVTGFQTQHFLPRGFFFPVYTLTTIQTTGQEDMIILGVAENVIFQHKVQLPFGTRLLGTAAASNFEDRVMVNIDTILYPDGRELPISAFLKDASDLSSGVKGYYIPQPLRIQMVPYINEFLASWTEAVTSRLTNISSENTDVSNTNGPSTILALESSANLIRKQADKIQARLERRYPEKVVVPIGTKAYVQLRSALDLTRAQIAGSSLNSQPILPGFENNPITPSGQIERTANRGSIGTLDTTSGAAVPAQPIPVAPLASPTAVAAQQQQRAEEAAYYANTLKQLENLQKQLDASKTQAPAPSAPKSNINWPQGDVE